jgi:hypothetical protein
MLAAAIRVVEKLQATAKGDLLGQMQLAEAVKRRFMFKARGLGCRQ